MTAAPVAPPAEDLAYVHLHLPFDMADDSERRFAELIRGLPNGTKTQFIKQLLVEFMPKEEEQVDLLLARFIRQHKFRGRRRGRPTKKKAAPVPRAAPPQASGVDRREPEVVSAVEAGAHVGAQGKRPDFSGLAGGTEW